MHCVDTVIQWFTQWRVVCLLLHAQCIAKCTACFIVQIWMCSFPTRNATVMSLEASVDMWQHFPFWWWNEAWEMSKWWCSTDEQNCVVLFGIHTRQQESLGCPMTAMTSAVHFECGKSLILATKRACKLTPLQNVTCVLEPKGMRTQLHVHFKHSEATQKMSVMLWVCSICCCFQGKWCICLVLFDICLESLAVQMSLTLLTQMTLHWTWMQKCKSFICPCPQSTVWALFVVAKNKGRTSVKEALLAAVTRWSKLFWLLLIVFIFMFTKWWQNDTICCWATKKRNAVHQRGFMSNVHCCFAAASSPSKLLWFCSTHLIFHSKSPHQKLLFFQKFTILLKFGCLFDWLFGVWDFACDHDCLLQSFLFIFSNKQWRTFLLQNLMTFHTRAQSTSTLSLLQSRCFFELTHVEFIIKPFMHCSCRVTAVWNVKGLVKPSQAACCSPAVSNLKHQMGLVKQLKLPWHRHPSRLIQCRMTPLQQCDT